MKTDIFGGSFGSAVDAKDEKLLLYALSLRSVYLVARLARQWMQRTRNCCYVG